MFGKIWFLIFCAQSCVESPGLSSVWRVFTPSLSSQNIQTLLRDGSQQKSWDFTVEFSIFTSILFESRYYGFPLDCNTQRMLLVCLLLKNLLSIFSDQAFKQVVTPTEDWLPTSIEIWKLRNSALQSVQAGTYNCFMAGQGSISWAPGRLLRLRGNLCTEQNK